MKDSARRLWPYIRRYKRGFLLGFGALVLKDLAAAGQPLLIKTAIDSLTSGFSLSLLWKLCAALVVLSGVKGLFQYWMRVILIGISRDIEYDLRNDLFRHLAGSPPISTRARVPATSWRAPPTISTRCA